MTVTMAQGTASEAQGQARENRRSSFFVVHFTPGGFAAAHAEQILQRVGRVREGLATTLAGGDLPRDPIEIALDDHPGASRVTEPAAIHVVCTPDAPASALEGLVLERLLRASFGLQARNASFLVDGLLGRFASTRHEIDLTAVNWDLAHKARRDELPTLAEALAGGGTLDPTTVSAEASSFVSWLLDARGVPAFVSLVRDFDPGKPEDMTRGAYAAPLSVLEAEWQASLASAHPTMGVLGMISRSIGYLRPYARQQVVVLLLMAAGIGFQQGVLPFSQKYLIDVAIGQRKVALVVELLAVLLVLFVVQGTATLAKDYLSARTGARVMSGLRGKLFEHLQVLSMRFHGRNQVGDLMSRFATDMESVQRALTTGLLTLVEAVGGIVVGLVIMFGLEWRLSAVSILTWVVFVVGPGFIGPRAARASAARQEDVGRLSSAVQENLLGQAVVKVFGLQGEAYRRFGGDLQHLLASETRVAFLSSLFAMVATLSNVFVQVVTLGFGGYLVIKGQMTLGALVAFLGIQGSVIGPILMLSTVLSNMQQASGGLQRVEEVLYEPPDVADRPDAKPLAPFAREIHFDHVDFHHRRDKPTLVDVDFTLPRGGWYALVGSSGCGKSTSLSLLMRLFDPASGRVTIDGVDIRDVTQDSLRAQMGVVLQDTFLFNISVRENIRYGRLGATDQEIEEAARQAEIHTGIMAMSAGYDTLVGERGGKLSGGQRQRIGIARALLRNPTVLLLDEATSALDPQTETQLNATLRRVSKDRTVISVTHHLDTVVHADRIVVFDRGRIMEQGRHEELLAADGMYAQLWEQQHGEAGEVEARMLGRVPILKHLAPDNLATLARLVVTERFGPGEIMARAGEPGDKLYILVQGRAEVFAPGPAGTEQHLAEIHTGDYVGEVALLKNAARTASVRSLTVTTALTVARKPFLTLLDTNPSLKTAFEAGLQAQGHS